MIIDGKLFAQGLRAKLTEQIAALKATHGLVPGLTVILVGEDPASQVYVRNKQKFAEECGMNSVTLKKDASTTQAELLDLIATLNADPTVHGILVQLPLPKHIHEQTVLQAILPAKDVDGFHPVNVGRLSIGEPSLVPCTPLGSLLLLKDKLGDLTGKKAVIVGRSNIVGKPMFQLLLRENCTVTVAHSRTKNLPEVCKEADIIVAAVGQPLLIKGEWVKEGATIIDVGINRIEVDGKNKLVGDVDFDSAAPKAEFITPVPGGVGPMTIACLLRNTLSAACMQNEIEDPNRLMK
ncbi:bifunctional methylenetetrahydrofolate dehydrogenase/methenyltetrahydrofolate cyclohydrolase FolD [Wohlfahrtiimonas chitiniclastica]|uniref:bifunctional methylenetetrahydrofolate dehydrogenase/methenyltetrahydrofolate cyclohydrolase FolD n=1 Tax=Wohlfahrtiimonas chitiniclastica TaxID=400946 RepID=UPI0007B40A63|nr:bifunctional methylenetetrahydrofolate dehydrogenase/methenyltetrahydrofolate cyclohydrolase FolD [Wohlfahrtiimonas chitiniclastica]KZS22936.1 bifunctional 5,10-methylene-tetrahydrofolate dehydrogenase/5,10-methylene-tetrahydrofolate cyclohydrolase [Wohlfahrtiimonas chitiniclastica]WHR55377.1 bifunctional methylenetetrahydrofolate dehydrogenase/methenyltetrahydrofolate cyclohydrolase FolD [Wohlfahrtiimonas chitiniclastica]